jgi:hypothetical protein
MRTILLTVIHLKLAWMMNNRVSIKELGNDQEAVNGWILELSTTAAQV